MLPKIVRSDRVIILKARQLGLTWMVAAYVLWLAWTRALQLIIVISVTEDLSVEFLERVYFMLDRLHEELRPHIKARTRQSLEIDHPDGLHSIIKSMPTTEMGAQSKTPTLLVLDETARNRLVSEIYSASLPGIDAGGGRVIVISNSIKDAPGWSWTRDIYTASMRGENSFERIFMSWQARPERPGNFRELKLMDGMTPEDFSQHYPETEEEAISSIGGAYFGDAIGRHGPGPYRGTTVNLERINDGFEVEQNRFGPLEIWKGPILGWRHRYAIGADVSEGLGNTYSVAYVMDRVTDEIVARLRSNRIDAHRWAEMVNDLADYYGRALVCPERTGAGQTTIKRLRELDANLYVRVKADKSGHGVMKVYGWEESRNSKHELAADLRAWLKHTETLVPCATLLDECATFIKHEDGGLGHEDGKLDDCVIAAGLMLQAARFVAQEAEMVSDKPKIRRPPADMNEVAALERATIEKEALEAWKAEQEAWFE